MWALQQEANRQLMFANEQELTAKQKQMAQMHRDTQKSDKHVKKERWTNYYNEKEQMPELPEMPKGMMMNQP